jgi:hypothetical protein
LSRRWDAETCQNHPKAGDFALDFFRFLQLVPVSMGSVSVAWQSGASSQEHLDPQARHVVPQIGTATIATIATVRRRHGTAAKPQVLCANLDLAILVLSIEPNFSEAIFMDQIDV